MTQFIEFHDSRLLSAVDAGHETRLELDAYMHRWERRDGAWVGTGWSQPIRVSVAGARRLTAVGLPRTIGTGVIIIPGVTYENGVPLPFTCENDAQLTLILENGDELSCSGSRLAIEMTGD